MQFHLIIILHVGHISKTVAACLVRSNQHNGIVHLMFLFPSHHRNKTRLIIDLNIM